MLPFTTYNIPENLFRETPLSSNWLWVVIDSALSVPEEELLGKICAALKANIDGEVFIVSVERQENLSLTSLASSKPKLILSFGIPPSNLGLWIDLNSPGLRFLESYTFILTTSLDELNKSPSGKKQLWNSIQLFLELNESK